MWKYIKGRMFAITCAFAGLAKGFKNEPNSILHLTAVIIVIPAGFYFELDKYEWLAVVLTMGLVFSMEWVNTSVERLCDFVHPDYNKHIGEVKDIVSGAVLLSAIAALAVACIVFGPKIMALFQ